MMDAMAADEDRNFTVEGSKPVTRTHYSRALITFSALMAVLLAMLLAAQRPADGLVIDGDLCLPPYCPPETTITSAPLETDTSSTARFEFRGSTYWSNLRFECQLDGGGWSACTSPKEYTGLSDGSHTFQVRAIDSRSIDYSPASHTWTIYATQPPPPDTIAPRTTLTNYPYSTITSTTARFDFTGSDDRTRPTDLTFECRFDGTSDADWSACASPKEYAGLSDGPHTFQVRAKDPAGNVDLTPESRQFSVDTTPPNTNITLHPSDPSTDSFPRFEFSGSDNVNRFECRILLGGGEINDSGWFYCSSPYDFWSAVPRGTHTFQVRATDIWYRTDPTPASYTWTRAVPPETTIDSGPSGTVSGTTASFSFSSSDRDATFECRLDDGAFEGCVSRKEYTGLSEGRHTFEVRASTSSGTDATPETRTWTVDTVAPSAPTITSPSDDSFYADGNFTLSGVAENGSIVELLEGPNTVITVAASESGDWSVPLRGVAQGEHTYSAITRDAANNASERSGVLKVTVDKTAPRVDSTSPVPGEKGVERAADITVTFSDRMDESTLTTQGLKLVNTATGKRVNNVAVRYDDATRTLELDPFGSSVTPLAKNTKYRVTISTSVKNRAGSPLDQNPGVSGNQPKSWTFTTGSR